jgi:hypothetical protein
MENPLAALDRSVAVLRRAFADALPAFGVQPAGFDAVLEGMADPGLCEVVEALAQVSRVAGGLTAAAANEVAKRSRPELGQEGLAKQRSFSTPQGLIAAVTGGSMREAAKLVAVGEATSTRSSFSGERQPARFPVVAKRLASGEVSVAAAVLITGMLDRVAPRADAVMLVTAEHSLAANALGQSAEFVARLVKAWEARLDPDGVEPREEELHHARFLSVAEDRDGSIVVKARFDPVNGAAVTLAIDAIVGAELRRARDAFGAGQERTVCEHMTVDLDGMPVHRADAAGAGDVAADVAAEAAGAQAECSCTDPVFEETRTIGQMRADALADLCRHMIGCTESGISASTTLVIRTDLDPLTQALGVATIDGVDQPVSAATARQLAASAGIIPAVMGGGSEVLDLGQCQRLFTRAEGVRLFV